MTACVKHNDILDVVLSYADNIGRVLTSNNGQIRRYVWSTGNLLAAYDGVPVGHGNSVAFYPDDGCLYIAPIWDYSQDGRPEAKYIYKFNPLTQETTKLYTGDEDVFGISYDYDAGKLYMMAWGLHLLVLENGTLTRVCSITNPWGSNESLQDFAIRDGIITLTSARDSGIIYRLEDDEAVLVERFNFLPVDTQFIFKLGEVEGMEYDENGHLICSFLRPVSGAGKSSVVGPPAVPARQMTCGFITEIVTSSGPVPYAKPLSFRNEAISQTFYCQDDAYSNLRLPNNYSIRKLEQRNAFVDPIPRVQLRGDLKGYGADNYIEIITPLILDMYGQEISNCRGLRLYADLKIVGNGTLDFSGGAGNSIYCYRGGVWIVNSANLTVYVDASGNNNFINPGGETQMIYDGGTITNEGTGGDLYVYQTEREQYALYVGSRKVAFS